MVISKMANPKLIGHQSIQLCSFIRCFSNLLEKGFHIIDVQLLKSFYRQK